MMKKRLVPVPKDDRRLALVIVDVQKKFIIDVGYERFLGPEIFFHPEVKRRAF